MVAAGHSLVQEMSGSESAQASAERKSAPAQPNSKPKSSNILLKPAADTSSEPLMQLTQTKLVRKSEDIAPASATTASSPSAASAPAQTSSSANSSTNASTSTVSAAVSAALNSASTKVKPDHTIEIDHKLKELSITFELPLAVGLPTIYE